MSEVQTGTPAEPEASAQQPVEPIAWPAGIAGVVLVIVGCFLSWSYDSSILNDLSISLYPGGLQILAIIGAVLALVLLLAEPGPLTALGSWLDATLGLPALGLGLTLLALVIVAITVESDGLINVNPGAYVSLAGAVLILVSSRMLPLRQPRDLSQARLPDSVEILAISVMMAVILFAAAYALGLTDAWSFILCLLFIGTVILALFRTGLITWLNDVAQRHKKVLTLAAFVIAFFFPFTQRG